MTRYLALLAPLLVGCSGQEQRGVCGESFCLPAAAQLIDKKTPVEDFNLYEVEWRGEQFGIYEGNHPQPDRQPVSSKVRLPLDQSAALRMSGGRGTVLLKIETDCQIGEPCWPQYLDVWGPCKSVDQCPVKAFAAQLTRRY